MKRRITVGLLIIFLMGMILPSMAMASDVKKNKEKLNNVNKDIKNVEKKMEETKNEKKEVKNELVELDQQLEKAAAELKKAESELAVTNQKLDQTKKELSEAEEAMKEQNGALSERVRVMYKNGTMGYLEVLLDAKSFSDFITRFDVIRTIMDYDFELLTSLEQKRDEIEKKRETIEKEQQRMITLKNQLKNREKEVKTLQVSRQNYLGKMNSNIAEYEKQMNALEKDAAAAEQIIKAAMQKEAERQKQAQNSGNNGSSGNSGNTGNTGSYTGGILQWPVPGHSRISSPYGWRTHPIYNSKKFHTGIDIPAPTGTSFVAPGDGKVTYAGYLGTYGKVVIVDLGGGISILGAHNSSVIVSAGQSVSKGQTIAKIGTTGASTGPHSHFEVRKNGGHTNPIPYVK